MDYKTIIGGTVRPLERIREERPAFQYDALWKLGAILRETLDNEAPFHERVSPITEPDIGEAKEWEGFAGPDLPSDW